MADYFDQEDPKDPLGILTKPKQNGKADPLGILQPPKKKEAGDFIYGRPSGAYEALGYGGRSIFPEITEKPKGKVAYETDILPGQQTRGFAVTDVEIGKKEYPTNLLPIGKAALLGLSSVASGTLKSIGIAAKELDLFDEYKDKKPEDLATYKAGQWIDEQVKDLVGDLTPEEQGIFAVKLAQGFGQMGGFMLGGIGAKVLKMSPVLTAAGLGAAVQGSSEYKNAIKSGATPEQAAKVYWINSAIGTTEVLPIMSAFRKLDKYSGGLATGALARKLASTAGGRITNEIAQGFFNEAMQEGVQQILTNTTAKNTYDVTRKIFEDVGESMAIGGIIGSAMNGALAGIREKRNAANITPEEDAQLAKAEKFAEQKIKETQVAINNGNYVDKVKENVSHLPEKQQSAFVKESLKEKLANDEVEKLTDPTLIKKEKEKVKESQEIKEQLLQGKDPDEIVTEAQQKKIDEAEKNKTELERLTFDRNIALKKIDAKIEEIDGRESEANRIKLQELKEEKRRINEDYEKKSGKLQTKEPALEPITEEQKPQEPIQSKKPTRAKAPQEILYQDIGLIEGVKETKYTDKITGEKVNVRGLQIRARKRDKILNALKDCLTRQPA